MISVQVLKKLCFPLCASFMLSYLVSMQATMLGTDQQAVQGAALLMLAVAFITTWLQQMHQV